MLSVRYLAHKLQSQNLNEEPNYPYKHSDPERDSGTESDDDPLAASSSSSNSKMELDNSADVASQPQRRSSSGAATRERARSESGKENTGWRPATRQQRLRERGLRERSDDDRGDSPVDLCDFDPPWTEQHSSEEELECINGPAPSFRFGPSAFASPRNNRQSLPEKRKRSQLSPRRRVLTPASKDRGSSVRRRPRSAAAAVGIDSSSASSDDEIQALVESPLPVEFRASPPEGAHRPMRTLSPPSKLFVAEEREPPVVASNAQTKRSRHSRAHAIQRPWLDFEKMQQMKNRSVSKWRHDGELSLFCW